MEHKPDLGEQALGKIAEVAIANQLDEVEQVNIDIQTDPVKLIQGKVDSVAIAGEGLVMKHDLRVEAIELNTDSVAIDPLKAVFGQLELTQPTNAQAQIVLTEADLNRALRSDYLRNKTKNIKMQAQEASLTIDIQQAEVNLLKEGQLAFDIDIWLQKTNETKHLSAIVIPFLKDNGYRIEFEIISAEGQGLSLEFATVLFENLAKLLDLRNFDIGGLTLQLKKFDVQEGKLLLQALTTIEKLPTVEE
ncbi:MAG: DUF2993 domain-containing protein [Cyanobacteria bacterium CRU_2_1]|nr:DUF2993 domain-containing protein [Cyanobacteria bacterium RU_5_0]NJR58010.1 DUF2993 domain-containing protein [Cyanobacteria bacterium CRU_2_1]